ncbi:flagellar biosynthetic protein FliO [Georgenia sp. H159]|uniref:flagellar biosynthetic protein FliO n=1 Tax=Georgenia sp. H159 TaxID=3076115 RepID=UPI002D7801EC|nr:flagellar biosynthetic protein FliO [Georgenia sp. H159]
MSETLLLALRVGFSLLLVLALLWFVSKRLGGGRPAGRRLPITVLGRQNLGRRSGVAVVDIAGRTLVLGVSDTEVRLLTELEAGPFRLADELGDDDGGARPAIPQGQLPQTSSPLGGSVLAPASWRASWEVLRDRVRR